MQTMGPGIIIRAHDKRVKTGQAHARKEGARAGCTARTALDDDCQKRVHVFLVSWGWAQQEQTTQSPFES
jgi:hypothetical protein